MHWSPKLNLAVELADGGIIPMWYPLGRPNIHESGFYKIQACRWGHLHRRLSSPLAKELSKRIMKSVRPVIYYWTNWRVQSLFSLQRLLQRQLLHLGTNWFRVSIPCHVVNHRNPASPNAASSTLHLNAIPPAVSAQTLMLEVLPPFPIAPIVSNPHRLHSPATSLYSHKFVPTAQLNVLQLSQDTSLLYHAIPLHVNAPITRL